ncbi:transcriptional regulator, TetR family [Fodinibius roseus]|uniref:Transcriptional regulator, TetR family n=1 Tax=Fodinibius roseus TaxID=1194090 RepID=A0A1M5FNH7_9BACT|nr:TetR/AcrR family transcriptional regulator [Fodinibius roseus]SHF92732.1 transcriptional regulator, TetR family [Fodinibius roseus]
MAENKIDTRSEIAQAARSEFIAHGYEGARLQRIADGIGVTKAMIHYYFNTKQQLFEHVFRQSVEEMFSGLTELLDKDIPLFKKIEQLISVCLDKAKNDPGVLGFVLTESNRNADWLLPLIEEEVSLEKAAFAEQIAEASASYTITSVDPNQLLLNIFSLCYYPSLSAPINRAVLTDGDDRELVANRQGIILDTILNWLTA